MFRVGDRVIAVQPVDGLRGLIGQTGTVVEITHQSVGVEFDEAFLNGHSCRRNGKDGHCRYGKEKEFELYCDEDITFDEEDVCALNSFLSTFTTT